MAQEASVQANGIPGPDHVEIDQSLVPVKRKREAGEESEDDTSMKLDAKDAPEPIDQKSLIRDFFETLQA
jgi:hypothetical protein